MNIEGIIEDIKVILNYYVLKLLKSGQNFYDLFISEEMIIIDSRM